MCGIAGFIRLNGYAPPASAVRRVALRLLSQIAERGDKATGYACAGRNGLRVVKDRIGVREFVERYGGEIRRDVAGARAWIAHSRFPSVGSVEQPFNNHPIFTKSGLAMVHNGVIYNPKEVFDRFGLDRDGEVDSEVILKLIEKKRGETGDTGEAIAQAVKYLDGSLTFALIDEARPGEVWLHKFGYSAPASVAVSGGLIVFASELGFLIRAMGRKSKGFLRLPTCKLKTLEDGELLHLSGGGIRPFKTDPESEVKRAWPKGDPDDFEAWGNMPPLTLQPFDKWW